MSREPHPPVRTDRTDIGVFAKLSHTRTRERVWRKVGLSVRSVRTRGRAAWPPGGSHGMSTSVRPHAATCSPAPIEGRGSPPGGGGSSLQSKGRLERTGLPARIFGSFRPPGGPPGGVGCRGRARGSEVVTNGDRHGTSRTDPHPDREARGAWEPTHVHASRRAPAAGGGALAPLVARPDGGGGVGRGRALPRRRRRRRRARRPGPRGLVRDVGPLAAVRRPPGSPWAHDGDPGWASRAPGGAPRGAAGGRAAPVGRAVRAGSVDAGPARAGDRGVLAVRPGRGGSRGAPVRWMRRRRVDTGEWAYVPPDLGRRPDGTARHETDVDEARVAAGLARVQAAAFDAGLAAGRAGQTRRPSVGAMPRAFLPWWERGLAAGLATRAGVAANGPAPSPRGASPGGATFDNGVAGPPTRPIAGGSRDEATRKPDRASAPAGGRRTG